MAHYQKRVNSGTYARSRNGKLPWKLVSTRMKEPAALLRRHRPAVSPTTPPAQDLVLTLLAADDHGDMLGERGLWYKTSYFELCSSATRSSGHHAAFTVPLNVSTLDILPTLVDTVGGKLAGPRSPAVTGALRAASRRSSFAAAGLLFRQSNLWRRTSLSSSTTAPHTSPLPPSPSSTLQPLSPESVLA